MRPTASPCGSGRTSPSSAPWTRSVHGLALPDWTDLVPGALDGVLDLVGEFAATGGEELDAVIGHGVVRGGDHNAEGGPGGGGDMRHGGSGEDAEVDHFGSGGGEPGGGGGFEHLAGGAWISPDDD